MQCAWMADPRQYAPATQRNREPILSVLREVFPAAATVLEVASGTGEHAVYFARALPGLVWQPSDPSPEARASIAAWTAAGGLTNVLPPIALDAASDWRIHRADAVLCINMVHISPWAATEGLIRGAARVLPAGGPLVLYGPYRRAGRELEPSDAAFDADLMRRDPAWGLRLLDDVVDLAATSGLALESVTEMPANNLTVVFRRA